MSNLVYFAFVVMVGVIIVLALVCHKQDQNQTELVKRINGVTNEIERLTLIMSRFVPIVKESHQQMKLDIDAVMKKLETIEAIETRQDTYMSDLAKYVVETKKDILDIDDGMVFIAEAAGNMTKNLLLVHEKLDKLMPVEIHFSAVPEEDEEWEECEACMISYDEAEEGDYE